MFLPGVSSAVLIERESVKICRLHDYGLISPREPGERAKNLQSPYVGHTQILAAIYGQIVACLMLQQDRRSSQSCDVVEYTAAQLVSDAAVEPRVPLLRAYPK